MSHDPTAASSAGQLLRLSLAELRCGVNIASVREILKPVPLTPLPLMPGFVCGVMNLRGSVVPVIDLAELLGLGRATRTRRSCIVIVETGAPGARLVTGLLVDAVHEVADLEAGALEAVPPLGTDIAGEHLAGIARLRGEPMPVLALDEILEENRLSARIGASDETGWRLAA